MGFYVRHSYLGVILLLVFVTVYAQNQLNDTCVLENGKSGLCVLAQNCHSAVEMIRSRDGPPEHCGFDGSQSIVCCEQKETTKRRRVGEMSAKKCWDTYASLPPVGHTRRHRIRARTIVIAGGENAKPAEYPHMAALGYEEGSGLTWNCGGSLISEKYVLTAAHCINTSLGPVKRVRVGDLDLKLTTDHARPQDRNVTRTIVHPCYRAPSVYNDIALIELSKNVMINDFVRPACLYTEHNITSDSWSATGWGLTSFLGTQASHLQTVYLRPFTLEECQSVYPITNRRLSKGIDVNSQICAGEDSKDTCQGDSGGPLQIKNSEFTRGYEVIGVTSFGKACGIGKGPAVYTRVSHYIEWIESIVWPI